MMHQRYDRPTNRFRIEHLLQLCKKMNLFLQSTLLSLHEFRKPRIFNNIGCRKVTYDMWHIKLIIFASVLLLIILLISVSVFHEIFKYIFNWGFSFKHPNFLRLFFQASNSQWHEKSHNELIGGCSGLKKFLFVWSTYTSSHII